MHPDDVAAVKALLDDDYWSGRITALQYLNEIFELERTIEKLSEN